MKKSIEQLLNNYEAANPDTKERNNQANKDLMSLGLLSPSKPIVMHVADSLDGTGKNGSVFRDNFDHLLDPHAKKIIDDETLEKAELTALLNHPKHLIDDSSQPSQTQEMGRDVLMYLLAKYGPEEGYKPIMKELFQPMLSSLLDKVIDEDTATKQILPQTVVNKTHHSPKDFDQGMEMVFTVPVFESHNKKNWKNHLPEIFEQLGESHG